MKILKKKTNWLQNKNKKKWKKENKEKKNKGKKLLLKTRNLSE